jgi:hypothetical protein
VPAAVEEEAPPPSVSPSRKKKKKKNKFVQWKWNAKDSGISLGDSLFKRKITSEDAAAAASGRSSSGRGSKSRSSKSGGVAAIPPYLMDVFKKLFVFADRDGDGSLTTMELTILLQKRAKGTALEGDMHAIFTLKTLLAQQARKKNGTGKKRQSSVIAGRQSLVDLRAHGSHEDHGEIGVREFARGITKAVVLKPNGNVAEWILKELQEEANEWSEHVHEGRVYFRHERDGKNVWKKPEIVEEMERCAALAGVAAEAAVAVVERPQIAHASAMC